MGEENEHVHVKGNARVRWDACSVMWRGGSIVQARPRCARQSCGNSSIPKRAFSFHLRLRAVSTSNGLVDPILARDASHTTERKSTHATTQATMAQAKDVWNQDRHGESLDVMSGEEITQIYRQCRRRSPFHFAKQVTLTDRIFE